MEPLLRVLKYIAEHPEKTIGDVTGMTKFSEGYNLLLLYAGKKLLFCPCCKKYVPLTKHHITPKKNGGKGLIGNFIYICRSPCHDIVHEMFSKKQKIEAYLLEHPDETEDSLMRMFRVPKYIVLQVTRPEYILQAQLKYEARISKRVSAGLEWFSKPEEMIRLV